MVVRLSPLRCDAKVTKEEGLWADGLNEAEEVLGLEPDGQRGMLGSQIQTLKLAELCPARSPSSCTLDPLLKVLMPVPLCSLLGHAFLTVIH